MATQLNPMPQKPLPGALIEAPRNQAFARASIEFAPESVDEEKLTVDVVAYTGAAVDRYSWIDGHYKLSLSLESKAVRLDRLKNGAPVLKNHSDWTLEDQVGVVEEPKLKDGKLICRFRFANDEDGRKIFNRVRDGIYRNVSIGLTIYKRKEMEPESEDCKHFLATDWEPSEVSIVPIPADFAAGFMSAQPKPAQAAETQLAKGGDQDGANAPKEKVMDKETMNGAQQQEQPAAPPVDTEKLRKEAGEEAKLAERKRQEGIRARVKQVGLSAEFADELCSQELLADQVADKIFEKLAAQSKQDPAPKSSRIEMGRDERATAREAMTSALLHKYNPGAYKLHEGGRRFMSMSLVEMARVCAEVSSGRREFLNREEVVRLAMHSSSDFPYILENVANKALRDAYAEQPKTYQKLGRKATAADFKLMSRVQLGEAADLLKVAENGEFKRGSIPEAKESYKIDTFGRIIAVSRQMIINDDLGAFTRIPAGMGLAAARFENRTVWDMITSNPVMGDGVACFHATHKNLVASGTVISADSVGKMRAGMRKQTGVDGKTETPFEATYIVVPVELETATEQFLSSTAYPQQPSQVVPASMKSLQPISDPRLDKASAIAWYLFANPAQYETFEYAYLEGQEGVYTEQEIGFDVDGVQIKARLDFGCKIIDWRGMYKNPGA